jgi:hypothetical protein
MKLWFEGWNVNADDASSFYCAPGCEGAAPAAR